MFSDIKPLMLSALLATGVVTLGTPTHAEEPKVIGANNTTYSPQNFSGRWKLRQPDGEICLVELKVTDTSPHDLGLRGCTEKAVTMASQWDLNFKDLVLLTADGKEAGVYKVTAPNTLEGKGGILFR